MNCNKFSEMLDNYENLTEDEKSDMLAHSRECEQCGRELDFMLSVKNTLRTLPKIDVPADFIDKLNERIDREEAVITRREKLSRHMKSNWQRYSAFAASLALAAVIGVNGKSMIDIINGSDDGVISQTTSTSSDGDSSEETESGEAAVSENGSASEVYTISDFALPPMFQKHRAGSAVSESGAADSASAPSYAEDSIETYTEVSEQSSVGANSGIEVSTAAPAVEAEASAFVSSSTAAPAASAASENPASTPNTVAAYTAEETPDAESGYVISDDDGTDTYAYAEENDTSAKTRSVSSYKLSTEMRPEDFHISIDGILSIKSSDYQAAITIIAKYVSGIYNDCYIITGTQFDNMTEELYSKDLSVDSSVIQSSDIVSFKIIVVD